MILLAIAIGGALGAVARYQAGVWFGPADTAEFPWSTLLINVVGSLLFAFIYRYMDIMSGSAHVRALLGVGFCGAFTTFSTFSFEAVRLMQDGQSGRAGMYVLASVVFSIAGTVLGLVLATSIFER